MSPSKSKNRAPSPYIWIPGQGPEGDALKSLMRLVPDRPRSAPGEAWFMSKDRRYFQFLLEHPVNELPALELDHFFFDMVSGIQSFKEATDEVAIWISWLDYLWPRLLDTPLDTWAQCRVGEMLYTAVFRLLAVRLDPYTGYRRDLLDTLGRMTMRPDLWDDNNDCTIAYFDDWPKCEGVISASLFLSLALLEEPAVELWTQSLLAVESPSFRAALLTWLAVACPILSQDQPFAAICADKGPREVLWSNCFLLAKTPLSISRDNIDAFMRTVRQDLVFEKVLHWVDSIELQKDMADTLKAARIVERLVEEVLR